MTNKEAKEKLYMEWQKFLEDYIDYAGISEAYKTAFKALDHEPCDDAVSRQAILEQIDQWAIGNREYLPTNAMHYLIRRIQDMPPVTPQPKSWEWIVHEKPHGIRYLECPHCNIWYLNEHLIRNSYCPNCGAKMVEP